MKKIGLTLGKYAPLHAGHMHVFETALQEVDELHVLIYQSSVTTIPLNIRAQWIRDLFPQIHVIEAWDGPEGYSNDRAFKIEQENYIIQKLNGVKFRIFIVVNFMVSMSALHSMQLIVEWMSHVYRCRSPLQ